MIYLITFQIKLAIQVILETISRREYSAAKQKLALTESCVGARLTERQPGVSTLLTAPQIHKLRFYIDVPLGF